MLRDGYSGEMIVDSGSIRLMGQVVSNYTQLNTDNNVLYVGGVSMGFSTSSLIPPNSQRSVMTA